MTAKRGRNAATLTIICTSTGEIDWKGWEYTIYTKKEKMFLVDWKTSGKQHLPKKNKFLAQGHDENLFAGLHVNKQQPINNCARE